MKKRMGMRFVMAALCLFLTAGAWAQSEAKDTLFAGAEKFAKGAKESNVVTLDKNALALAGGKGHDMSKMELIEVYSYEYSGPGMYKASDLEEFRHRLKGNGWSHIVSSKEEKEESDVWVRTTDNGESSEMVVISAEEDELSLVHLKGHMSLQDLTSMGAKYGAPTDVDAKLKSR